MSMDGARAARRQDAARTAATTGARKLRCPRCERKAALGERVMLDETLRWWVRTCRYCGHEVGMIEGRSFGRDVTPEPGVQS